MSEANCAECFLMFSTDVPTPPSAAPEHRKALGMRPEGVAHRTWATVPRDRSRVGQRGSQSRGAEEECGIGGGLFFRLFLLAATKEMDPGRGGRSPRK